VVQLNPSTRTTEASSLLRIAALSKTFVGTKALDDVSLDVRSGEVLAVVGQNGSGKSTLVKVLAGIHPPDPGATIEVRNDTGQLVPLHGAQPRGLHFIHQDLGLLPTLSTTENLDLGKPLGSRWLTPSRRRDEHAYAAALVSRFGAVIDVRAPVSTLSPAERAIVAIARAMDGWTRPDNVLVLDEPTTAFHSQEVQRLLDAVRRVAKAGAGVLFISHRLTEVLAIADRVVALRDGKKVAEARADEFNDASLVRAIVGATVAETRRHRVGLSDKVLLSVEGLSGRRLRHVSLAVSPGEIVGVSGVLGSGREEIGGLIFGAERRREGTVAVDGVALPAGDVVAAVDHGVAFVPADRSRHGAVMTMDVRENLTLPGLGSVRRRFGLIDRDVERTEARRWADTVGLRPRRLETRLANFSGGNQQKVVLAKWLRNSPRVLVLDEPTQGVDVGAKATIYELIQQAAAAGTAVLLSSSDTKELSSVCDRVLVVENGEVLNEFSGRALTEIALVQAGLTGPVPQRTATGDGYRKEPA
jgi:ABC-type sugar transport system ATPase subunit